jgi:hypothetical protein
MNSSRATTCTESDRAAIPWRTVACSSLPRDAQVGAPAPVERDATLLVEGAYGGGPVHVEHGDGSSEAATDAAVPTRTTRTPPRIRAT